ncbi:MAG: hypothetical protein ABJH28_06425 [Paraglaciecola sp.]|uniref:phosphoribosyltransferase-like protein n=1 Tax=Paraglaciecola sp. TaxID=1920173 RepID=UPI0032679899
MRRDVYINEVLSKCQAMKACGLWTKEPKIRPRAWLDNFDEIDKEIAAILLDNFIYYNAEHTDALLKSAYHSISTVFSEKKDKSVADILDDFVFTIVTGENPNLTDSGHHFIRRLRQLFQIPQPKIVSFQEALEQASLGKNIIFIDDFVGSGEQFCTIWERPLEGSEVSFAKLCQNGDFLCIYVTLIATEDGLNHLQELSPKLKVVTAHTLSPSSAIEGISQRKVTQLGLELFLAKYSIKISPQEDHIALNSNFLMKGYRNIGALIGFEHGVPDATLPIFWSPGVDASWVPLILRS